MKNFLLLISALLVTTGMIAQDVYSSGYFTQDGLKKAAVYKNNELLYSSSLGSYDNNSTSVVVSHVNDDVYWVRTNEQYGDVMKNNDVFLNQNAGTYINGLYWEPGMSLSNGNPDYCLWSAGYQIVDGVKYAAVWKGSNNTPDYAPNSGDGCESESFGVTLVEADGGGYYTYHCGYKNETAGTTTPRATVWNGNALLYTLSSEKSYAYGIDVYDGETYTVGVAVIDNKYVTKVWKNSDELYTLTDASANSRGWKIKVFGGDVYVCGWGTLRTQCIWKNGVPLYTYTAANTRGMSVTSKGIYHAVTEGNTTTGYTSSIYKDGQPLYTVNNCEYLYDIFVKDECLNSEIRTLPFFDGFEMGATDWACWTKNDVSKDYVPYWDLLGQGWAYEGDYCVNHGWGINYQEGWLISPQLFLQPGRDNTTLTFMSNEINTNYNDYRGVLVSTTDTDPSSFYEVWTQTNPSESWHENVIDLKDYQGQAIYIAFKDTGTDEIGWRIDNVSVTENWNPCGSYNLPYNQSFDSGQEPGYCWYILDNDHTGENKCWTYDSSTGTAYHTWGQNNGIKQEGWLFTPYLETEANNNITLTFKNQTISFGDEMKNSVWIAIDKSGVPNPSDYSQIWEQTDSFPDEWTEVEIDLSPYAGHIISLAFKYEGIWAHGWYVDDVNVTATPLSVDENEVNNLAIYPNPANDNIRINGLDKDTEVSIYNAMGVMVKTVVINGNDEINVSELPAGLYIARFGERTLRFTKE